MTVAVLRFLRKRHRVNRKDIGQGERRKEVRYVPLCSLSAGVSIGTATDASQVSFNICHLRRPNHFIFYGNLKCAVNYSDHQPHTVWNTGDVSP